MLSHLTMPGYLKSVPPSLSKIYRRLRNRTCLCVIMHQPNPVWLNFLNTFNRYEVFVVIDDNEINGRELYSTEYSKIHFIQMPDETCIAKGYMNVNYLIGKSVTGWEKALYYFSRVNTRYQQVWFIEDDVFLSSEQTLIDIDAQYRNSDFLATNCLKRAECPQWHHWRMLDTALSPPYFKSMVCANRMSAQLLLHISEYAQAHKTLFFLEVLFPTLAKQNMLRYNCPEELSTIHWRTDWNEQDMNCSHIFHPLKDIDSHSYYRKLLNNKPKAHH